MAEVDVGVLFDEPLLLLLFELLLLVERLAEVDLALDLDDELLERVVALVCLLDRVTTTALPWLEVSVNASVWPMRSLDLLEMFLFMLAMLATLTP